MGYKKAIFLSEHYVYTAVSYHYSSGIQVLTN